MDIQLIVGSWVHPAVFQTWIARIVVSLLWSTGCCLEVLQNCTARSCCWRTSDHLSIWCRWLKSSCKKSFPPRAQTSCDYNWLYSYLSFSLDYSCENQIVQLVPARRSRLQSSLAQDQAFDPAPAKEGQISTVQSAWSSPSNWCIKKKSNWWKNTLI